MKNKVKPKLRFPEFEDDLEERTLGELMEFKNGINASKEQYGSGVKFVNVLDILSNDYITYDRIIGRVDIVEETIEKYAVNYGDVLFQRSSETREEVGTANVYLDEENTATFGGFVIRGKKIGEYNPVYLNELLRTDSVRDSITSRSGGSTRYNVGQNILASVSVRLPTLNEQAKIANFLSALDEKIQKLTKKQTLLDQYKKGVMQRMFSQKTRFKDEQGQDFPDWEEKRLGDIAKFLKGKGISKADIIKNGKSECIRYGELYTHYHETIRDVISRTDTDPSNLVFSKKNDVIIPSSGETRLDIAKASCVLKEGIALGGDLNILRTKNNGVFLSYYLNFGKKQEIAALAQGVSVVHLYSSQLATLALHIPTIGEQKKIADFLTMLDEKINDSTKQIEFAQTYKKGLLQKMFV